MFDVGRVCYKIAGRDAGKKGVIVEVLDVNYVVIDGATRRRKCNVKHLEPTDQVISVKHGSASEDIAKALGIPFTPKKAKQKKEQVKKAPKATVKKAATPAQKEKKA